MFTRVRNREKLSDANPFMSMTKVCLTLVPCSQAEWEGEHYRNFVRELFWRQTAAEFSRRYSLTDDAESADLVVVLEPNSFKTRSYGSVLRSIAAVQSYPNRVFTINHDDAPLAFLPGIYAAMPVKRFEAGFTVAGGYLVNSPNRFIREALAWPEIEPIHLFTFRGAISAPVRKEMQRRLSALCSDMGTARFTVVEAWFNHTDVEKREYVSEILHSKFVLCPRGQGAASHRLFEVMELGRVPVIIADDWVEPVGPRWGDFSFRLPESEIRSIPKFLSDRESAFPMMAKMARAAWEEFFAPEVRLSWMLSQLESLKVARIGGSNDYRSRWNHPGLYRGNVGTPWSRFQKRFGLNKS